MPTAIYTLTNNRASNGTSYTGVNLGGGKTIYADFNGPALTDVTIHAVRYRWYGRYIGDGGSMTLRMNGVSMSGGLAHTGEANGERVIGLSGYSQSAFAQGSGTLTISLDIPGYFRVASWSNVEVDYTINTSDFTLSANEADAGAAVAVYINANSPTVSHRATCSFGTKSESRDIAAGVLSTSFSIPMEWLEEIPDTVRGTATMLLETLSNGNVIGSTSKTFDILCPVGVVPAFDTSCIPLYTVNGVTYPDVTGGYVQGKSGVTARINNATGLYGADIAGYVINVGGYGGTAFYGTKAVLNSGLLLYSGRVNVYFTVNDTRGRTAVKQETLDVAYYAEPAARDFRVWRSDEGGNEDDFGTYARYSAAWQHTALDGKNPLTVTLGFGEHSQISPPVDGWLMPGQKLTFDILKRYSVTLTLKDAYTTKVFTATLPSANFVMHFGAGGQSIAFGQACRRAEPSVEIAPGKKFYLYDQEISSLFAGKGAEADIKALESEVETSITEIRGLMLAHNLLDNSDFLHPVNQRGQNSYAVNGYTIDRWRTMATDTLMVGMEEANLNKEYRCVITDNSDNTLVTDAVRMLVANTGDTMLRIVRHPSNYYGALGDMATFKVIAQGEGLTYQWQHRTKGTSTWNNNTGAAAKTDTFSIGMESHRLNYEYHCVITDTTGATITSDAACMIVGIAPFVITKQPEDYSGKRGDMAIFTVEATGSYLTYQWQNREQGSGAWTDMLGVKLEADGISTTGTLYQYLEADPGETYTAAVCRMDGSIVCVTGRPADYMYNAPVAVETRADGLVIFVLSAGAYKWAALYKGEYTQQTLPAYSPKGYAAEMMECMRYYVTLGDIHLSARTPWLFYAEDFRFPIPMRIVPTVSFLNPATGNSGVIGEYKNGNYVDFTGLDVSATVYGIRLSSSSADGDLTPDTHYTGFFYASADI